MLDIVNIICLIFFFLFLNNGENPLRWMNTEFHFGTQYYKGRYDTANLEIGYSILNILSTYHLLPIQSLSLPILNLESFHTE